MQAAGGLKRGSMISKAHGLKPSNSTVGTGIGGVTAMLLIVFAPRFGITFTDLEASTLTIFMTVVAGYLPKSGRRAK